VTAIEEKLVEYIDDAYAMEQNVLRMLDGMIVTTKDPQMKRSLEPLVFENATGALVGTEHLLRPDIYERGTPPCPQQPGGEYIYNSRNDLWFCLQR
jgi:hypothetical protein